MIHQKEVLKIGDWEFPRNTLKHKITFLFCTFCVYFFNFHSIFSWIICWRLMKSVVCRKAFNVDQWEESLRMHKLVNVRKDSVDRRKHQSSKVLWLLLFEHYLSKEHSPEFSSFSHFSSKLSQSKQQTLSSKAMASAFSNAILLIVVVSVFFPKIMLKLDKVFTHFSGSNRSLGFLWSSDCVCSRRNNNDYNNNNNITWGLSFNLL